MADAAGASGDAPARGRARAVLSLALAADAAAEWARLAGGALEVSFGRAGLWSSRGLRPRSGRPRRGAAGAIDPGTSDELARVFRLAAEWPGDGRLDFADLTPDDPVPRGSRVYADAAAARAGGYGSCMAGVPSFLAGSPRRWSPDVAPSLIAEAVDRARPLAEHESVARRVAPAWRAAWRAGFLDGALAIAKRRAELDASAVLL